MTTTIPVGFTAAICKHPTDDTPRKILADYLEENGEPDRAEFIRIQCELAGKTCVCGRSLRPCPTCVLRRRERELLEEHGIRWIPQLDSWCVHTWRMGENLPLRFGMRKGPADGPTPQRHIEIEFSRGFVSAVTCTAADWLTVHEQLAWCWWPCGRCGGKGRIDVSRHGFTICPECDGNAGRVPPTTACPRCGGRRKPIEKIRGHWELCGSCMNTGRVPRECPATAQPIERVRLMTEPGLDEEWRHVPPFLPTTLGYYTNERWPGIAFELPSSPTVAGWDEAAEGGDQVNYYVHMQFRPLFPSTGIVHGTTDG